MNPLTTSAKRLSTILALTTYALVLFAGAALTLAIGTYDWRISGRLARMNGKATYPQVCALLKAAGKFHYDGTTHLYPQSPAVTEARRAGDCKDLALWLASKLNDPSVMFVLGHIKAPTAEGHAWLVWYGDGQLWVLDPTGGLPPMPASRVCGPADCYYVPERLITQYGTSNTKSSRTDSLVLEFNRLWNRRLFPRAS